MPRRTRLLLPGVPLHIVQSGHNKQACFHNESDRLVYLDRLREHAHATGCSLHAYVLMTNHVHLLASFSDINEAPRLVKHLAQQYSFYVNKRLGRSGTIWEGRYWSCPVPTETYLINCHRYIEANPVRARMVDRQEMYIWSSYRGNAGIAEDSLLTPHSLYLQLGGTDTERQLNYRGLSAAELTEQELSDIRAAMKEGEHVAARPPGRPRKTPKR